MIQQAQSPFAGPISRKPPNPVVARIQELAARGTFIDELLPPLGWGQRAGFALFQNSRLIDVVVVHVDPFEASRLIHEARRTLVDHSRRCAVQQPIAARPWVTDDDPMTWAV